MLRALCFKFLGSFLTGCHMATSTRLHNLLIRDPGVWCDSGVVVWRCGGGGAASLSYRAVVVA